MMVEKFNAKMALIIFVYTLLFSMSLIVAGTTGILIMALVTAFIPLVPYILKQPKRLIYIQILYNMVIKLAITDFGIPHLANYLTDIINALCFILAIRKIVQDKKIPKIINIVIVIFALFFESLIGMIINGQSVALYVWSLRNVYRFFIFMLSCIVLLEKEDVDKILKILESFVIINVVLCSYQYFVLKLPQDYISGTFGTQSGGNAHMNIFLTIIMTRYFIAYQNNAISIKKFLVMTLCLLYIATISELKIFYIEFVFILGLGMVLSKPNKRTIIMCIIGIVVIYIAIQMMYLIYPEFKAFFNIEKLVKYSAESGYSNANNLNRFTAIGTLDRMFFDTSINKLFGFGTGSAEVSQFSIFNSEFSSKYAETLCYNWFSHAFMFIENGYIGLVLYTLFFIVIFSDTTKMKRKESDKSNYLFVQIMSLICVLMMWYNSSLRMESAYMMFFALSIGYIYSKRKEKI